MNMSLRTAVLFGAFFPALGFAECPTNLPLDELITCIAVEESGQPYSEYLVELEDLAKLPPGFDEYFYIPTNKRTRLELYATARDAHRMKMEWGSRVLFVDVRTPSEVAFLGVPEPVDVNIPYMLVEWDEWDQKRNNYRLLPNGDFAQEIEQALKQRGLDKSSAIILICRSGNRSAVAANLLADLGYNFVYSVVDGYEGDKVKRGSRKGKRLVNGWKNSNLPWTYRLEREKVYTGLF